jgi:hypothetical protein
MLRLHSEPYCITFPSDLWFRLHCLLLHPQTLQCSGFLCSQDSFCTACYSAPGAQASAQEDLPCHLNELLDTVGGGLPAGIASAALKTVLWTSLSGSPFRRNSCVPVGGPAAAGTCMPCLLEESQFPAGDWIGHCTAALCTCLFWVQLLHTIPLGIHLEQKLRGVNHISSPHLLLGRQRQGHRGHELCLVSLHFLCPDT